MSLCVGRVYKLAGDKTVRRLLGKFLRLSNGPLHALSAISQYQLRTVCLHELPPFHTHRLRHHNDDPVAPSRRHRGQPNPGIPGGGLNDHRGRLQYAPGLRIIQHRLGHPVLDTAGRIEILQLCQDSGLQMVILFHMSQLQKWRPPGQLIRRCVNMAHSRSSFYIVAPSGPLGADSRFILPTYPVGLSEL